MTRRDLLTAAFPVAAAAMSKTARPPNVVVILCDDLGYGDVGCYGSSLPTPNLDRLASEGVRFTQFYSANPVCSPSRASLLTGRYPTRVGVPRVLFPKDSTGLPDGETTIAQMLKPLGYNTMCIGKWHLGHLPQYLPMRRGFDDYFGIPYSNDMDPPVLLRGEEIVEPRADMDTLTRKYTQTAVRFIEGAKDSPFFLYMPHTMPHIPLGASVGFRGKTSAGLYGDVVAEIDWSVGEVLRALKQHGVEDNTLVVFSSDNGPWYQGSPGRLRGRKGTTYEGGVRVPFIARMPGRIPRGGVSHGIGSTMDLLPTIRTLTGATAPEKPLDGIDIMPLLAGKRAAIDREALLFFDGLYVQCARLGRWKLHVARYNSAAYSPAPPGGRVNLRLAAPELYDLENDPDESYDVAPRHPEIVRDIEARIEKLMSGFPEDVRAAHEAATRVPAGVSSAGAYPRVAK